MKGILSADMQYAPSDSSFLVVVDANIDNLIYEGGRVGELMYSTVYLPLADNTHQVDMHFFRDQNEVMSATALYKMGRKRPSGRDTRRNASAAGYGEPVYPG